MRGRNAVSMSGFLVHFSGYSMRIVWHRYLSSTLLDQLTRRLAVAAIITKRATGGPPSMPEQSYKNHAKFVPMFHGVLFALIVIAFLGSLVNLYRHIGDDHGRTQVALFAIITFAMLLLSFFARIFAMKVQDRAIRAEENLRHFALTGKMLDHRLNIKQIVGLRFASDGEFVDLARKAADEGLSMDDIKKSVKHWRPDHDRA